MRAGREASVAVRPEQPGDHAQVYAVHEAAFGRPNEARLVEALRASAAPQLSLVAVDGGQVVGHVFFSPVELEPRQPGPPIAGLAPVGVLPARQGQGIGSSLVRAGVERCAALGWQAVVLVGDPAYYARFGFVPGAPLGLRYGARTSTPPSRCWSSRPAHCAAAAGRCATTRRSTRPRRAVRNLARSHEARSSLPPSPPSSGSASSSSG